MTGLLILIGLVVGVLALGHCLLGMVFGLPFHGRERITFWALVGGSILIWIAAFISHLIDQAGVTA